jgi:hypothetical protein
MRYTGTISVLQGHSSPGSLKLRHGPPLAVRPSHWNHSVRHLALRTTNNRDSVLLSCGAWRGGGDHTVICLVYAVLWLDASSRSTASKEWLKCLLAVSCNYGVHAANTHLQQCNNLHVHIYNRMKLIGTEEYVRFCP